MEGHIEKTEGPIEKKEGSIEKTDGPIEKTEGRPCHLYQEVQSVDCD